MTELQRVCLICGGWIKNQWGYCQRSKPCKNALHRVMKKAWHDRERESGHGLFSCLGCGKPVYPNRGSGSPTTYTCGQGRCRNLALKLGRLIRGLDG